MSSPIQKISAEEVIFYIDIISDIIKRKHLSKAIKNFIEERKDYPGKCSFGLVMFQSESNPASIYDKTDVDSIVDTLNEVWSSRETKKSYFENGLFEILSYVFGKSKKNPKNYRIIVISDAPSNVSDDYHNALYDLIVKAKNFATSVDIIRIGEEKFYSDEVKLKITTSETQGGVFFCSDHKHFYDILGSLVKNRREFNIVRPGEDQEEQILEKDKKFYDRLAVDLISLDADDEEICTICQQELCPICGAYTDEIRKCYNCGAKFHGCCAAEYSLSKNIGFKHIFRCPQCETLLKLDEDFVEMIDEESRELDDDIVIEEIVDTSEEDDLDTFEEPIDEDNKYVYHSYEEESTEHAEDFPQIVEDEEIPTPLPPPDSPNPFKKVKVGGFFGKEITIENKQQVPMKSKIGEEPLPNPQSKSLSEEPPTKNISITKLRPPSSSRAKIKFCKICGASVKNSNTCPNCGARVD